MRLSLLATATLGIALISTAASAAVIPPRIPRTATPYTVMGPCHDDLGMLMTVHKDDVMAVDFDNTVVVRPVCQEDHLDGNASGLRGIIGRNDAMAMALESADYRPEDVVGIQFGAEGVVLLYVME
jgi:hypothetical protein